MKVHEHTCIAAPLMKPMVSSPPSIQARRCLYDHEGERDGEAHYCNFWRRPTLVSNAVSSVLLLPTTVFILNYKATGDGGEQRSVTPRIRTWGLCCSSPLTLRRCV
jgi:hypothetical protein